MNRDLECHQIPGTSILVDWFRPLPSDWNKRVDTVFFLSHFHGDHYGGLTSDWDKGVIHCSELTGNLVERVLGVNSALIKRIAFDIPQEMFLSGKRVRVTLVDANHCPGAAMLLFDLPQDSVNDQEEKKWKSYLHTGDFRFAPRLLPLLERARKKNSRLEAIFLDTTYCHPKHTFADQGDSIQTVIDEVRNARAEKPNTLFLLSAYNLGKERILLAVAKALKLKIFADKRKLRVLECLGWEEEMSYFTPNRSEASIHVCRMGFCGEIWPFFRANFKNIQEYMDRHKLEYKHAMAFIPTGWADSSNYNKRNSTKSKNNITVRIIPYSEHSNFPELVQFVKALRPVHIVPTVFSDAADRQRIKNRFSRLTDSNTIKRRFLSTISSAAHSQKKPSHPDFVSLEASLPPMDTKTAKYQERTTSPTGGTIRCPVCMYEASSLQKDSSSLTNCAMCATQFDPGSNSVTQLPAVETAVVSKGSLARIPLENPEISREEEGVEMESTDEGEVLTMLPPEKGVSPPGSPGLGKKKEEGAAFLSCPSCTLHNDVGANKCKVCGTPLDGSSAVNNKNGAKIGGKRKGSTPASSSKKGKKRRKRPVAGKNGQLSIKSFFASPNGRKSSQRQLSIKKMLQKPTSDSEEKNKQKKIVQKAVESIPIECHVCTFINLIPNAFTSSPSTCEMCSCQLHVDSKNADSSLKDSNPVARNSESSARNSTEMAIDSAGNGVKAKTGKREASPRPKAEAKQKRELDSVSKIAPRSESKPALKLAQPPSHKEFMANFDTDLDKFDPYHPGSGGGVEWKPETKENGIPYMFLAHAFESLSSTTKRLRKLRILTNLFRSSLGLSPGSLEDILYLCTNDLSPAYSGIVLSIGGATISWAVTESSGVTRQRMHQLYKKYGDLGDVAHVCRARQRVMFASKPLTIGGVRAELLAIAKESGKGSQTQKKKRILRLLTRCRSIEVRWIVRTLCLHLRTGATRTSCLSALAQAKVLHDYQHSGSPCEPGNSPTKVRQIIMDDGLKERIKTAQKTVADAFNRRPDLGEIVRKIIAKDATIESVESIVVSVGLPICCMLANTTRSIDQILGLHGGFEDSKATAQYKYDGQRAQIHCSSTGDMKIFSRHNDDITVRFSDVLKAVRKALKPHVKESCEDGIDYILDAEICGVERGEDGKASRLLSFQQFSTRAKKLPSVQNEIAVCVFVFDMLYATGTPLLNMPLCSRARLMRDMFDERPGEFEFATERECTDAKQLDDFLKQSLAKGCEGLVVKLQSSKYTPGKRENMWLKLKPDYSDTMGDSIDVVPVGAWWGNGRKAGWFSPFLLAVWDPEMEQYQTLCRCISGFTDEFYKTQTEFYKSKLIAPSPHTLRGEHPSIWFEPSQVWEIRGAELTVSPVHKAGEGLMENHPGKGLSVRFPRFIRMREDKAIDQTTAPEQLVRMFTAQTRRL